MNWLKLGSLLLTVVLSLKSKGSTWVEVRDAVEDNLLSQVGLTRADVDSVVSGKDDSNA